jgi:cell division transport system permease protein
VMRGYWSERAQVAVYMCSAVSESDTCVDGAASEEQVASVRAQLEGDALAPLISSMTFDTKEDTYAKLVEQVGEEQASVITPDQAFEVFFVTMKDPGQSQVLSEAFSGQTGVEQVKDQLQYLEPLFSALTVATYVAVGIAVLMLIAATLLIATTIRLSAYARRKEIGIMRLVGASNRFIQTPFVLEGVFAAFLGSAFASAAIVAGVHFGVNGYLRGRVPFITTWIGMQDAAWVVPVLIGIGVVLAALSAGFAIRRWLRT